MKMRQFAYIAFITYFLANILWGCANIGTLSGGEKDEQPPQLDTLYSTENFQTNFTQRSFELTYDEWIKLQDVFNQVIVSPPLAYRPEVTIKKKTVEFKFNKEEVLRENATYVINFGEAIEDFTEGNPAEMIFVFSTGDYIDSLSVSGQIVDALTKEPMEEVLFMMYENTADSVFRTERPFYFGKSDDDGFFTVNNVKSGTFKGVALIDRNLNYLFDNPSEIIGFMDSTFVVADSIDNEIFIQTFQEEERLFLKDDVQEDYGNLKLVFNRKYFDEPIITYDTIGQFFYAEQDRDTMEIWYNMDSTLNWTLYVQIDTIRDTIVVKPPSRTEFLTENQLVLETRINPEVPKKLNPKNPIKLSFSHPLNALDTSGIFLLEDSTRVRVIPKIEIDSAEQRSLVIRYPWKENMLYNLEILPNRVLDQFGLVNLDTIRASYNALSKKEFGNIVLNVLDLVPDTNYVVRLLFDGNLVDEVETKGSSTFTKNFKLLVPGTYDVEIIEDVDENGRWSTGNYDLKKQPERIFTKTLEELRANWDVDAEVSATPNISPTPNNGIPTGGTPPSQIPDGDFNNRINNSGRGN